MVQQPAVGRIDRPPGQQPVDRGAQPLRLGGDRGLVQRSGIAGVADRKRTLEDPPDGVRGLGLATLGIAQQLAHATQQVGKTALVDGTGELAVRRPPVPLQHPREALPKHCRGVVVPAVGGDAVHRDLLARERPQPGAPAADAPASLIWGHDRAGFDPVQERGVGRLAAPRRASNRLGHPTRSHRQAELAQQPRDLADRQPQSLVTPGRQRDRARPKLDGGRAEGVRGLLGMARLNPAATALAAADLQLVAADLGRSGCGQVLLPLAGDPFHDQRTAARRAHRWQPHRHHPVDPLRRQPPPPPPVRLARLAARPPRCGFGRSLENGAA
jgi:hypothetical protein